MLHDSSGMSHTLNMRFSVLLPGSLNAKKKYTKGSSYHWSDNLQQCNIICFPLMVILISLMSKRKKNTELAKIPVEIDRKGLSLATKLNSFTQVKDKLNH